MFLGVRERDNKISPGVRVGCFCVCERGTIKYLRVLGWDVSVCVRERDNKISPGVRVGCLCV